MYEKQEQSKASGKQKCVANIWQKSHSKVNLANASSDVVKAGELAIFKVPEEGHNGIERLCPCE